MNYGKLKAIFESLGAKNPELWAKSQIEEGIPQLARFVFLKKAWNLIVKDGDHSWIDAAHSAGDEGAGSEIIHSLSTMTRAGVSPDDITMVVRVMQWRLLFSLCYLLDDPGQSITGDEDISWRLFQVDDHDVPLAPIANLYESVLELDPSRTEMGSR